MWETRIQSLGWEDLLEKEMATHSSILVWKIPWTETMVGYSPWGHRVGSQSNFTFFLSLSSTIPFLHSFSYNTFSLWFDYAFLQFLFLYIEAFQGFILETVLFALSKIFSYEITVSAITWNSVKNWYFLRPISLILVAYFFIQLFLWYRFLLETLEKPSKVIYQKQCSWFLQLKMAPPALLTQFIDFSITSFLTSTFYKALFLLFPAYILILTFTIDFRWSTIAQVTIIYYSSQIIILQNCFMLFQ